MTSPLHLTIRFSNSLPDTNLDIPSPSTTTVLTLKHLIRQRITSRSRLRLIHQGRLLPDSSALSSVIKPAPPPPPESSDPKGKGKAKELPPARTYINCSIADDDELSPAALAAEAEAAEKPFLGSPSAKDERDTPTPSTRPRPKGFDRLLTAGFTQPEIATLRTQFSTMHAERYPPDAPPSPDTLRALEDAWIDSNANPNGPPGGEDSVLEDTSSISHNLDVLVKGMMIGFFFPLGTMTWVWREDSWGPNWRSVYGVGIFAGLVFSIATGLVMGLSGDMRT